MKGFSHWSEKVSSKFDLLSEYLALAGGAIIVGLMLLISVATMSRYFFGQAMAWSTEVGAFSLILITFLGGPLLARNNGHISVDILPNLLAPRGARKVVIFASSVALLVSLFLGWYGIATTVEAYVAKQMVVSILRTPKYLLLAVVAVGFILMGVGFLQSILKQLNFFKTKT